MFYWKNMSGEACTRDRSTALVYLPIKIYPLSECDTYPNHYALCGVDDAEQYELLNGVTLESVIRVKGRHLSIKKPGIYEQ